MFITKKSMNLRTPVYRKRKAAAAATVDKAEIIDGVQDSGVTARKNKKAKKENPS